MTLYPPNRFWPLANAGSTDGKGLSPEEGSPTAERTTIDGKGMSPEEGSSTIEFPTTEDCLSMASKDSPTAERTTIAEAPPITACSTFSTEAECLPMASTPDFLFPPCRETPQSNLPICFTLAFHCSTVQCVCFFLSCSNMCLIHLL